MDDNADAEEEQKGMGNVDIESGPITVDAQAVGLMVGFYRPCTRQWAYSWLTGMLS